MRPRQNKSYYFKLSISIEYYVFRTLPWGKSDSLLIIFTHLHGYASEGIAVFLENRTALKNELKIKAIE